MGGDGKLWVVADVVKVQLQLKSDSPGIAMQISVLTLQVCLPGRLGQIKGNAQDDISTSGFDCFYRCSRTTVSGVEKAIRLVY